LDGEKAAPGTCPCVWLYNTYEDTDTLEEIDDRSHQFIYLGIEEGSNAHHLYDPRHSKVHVSCDVIFEENMEWNWSSTAESDVSSEFFVVEDIYTATGVADMGEMAGVSAPVAESCPATPIPAVPTDRGIGSTSMTSHHQGLRLFRRPYQALDHRQESLPHRLEICPRHNLLALMVVVMGLFGTGSLMTSYAMDPVRYSEMRKPMMRHFLQRLRSHWAITRL
jgi:hypothetical protein